MKPWKRQSLVDQIAEHLREGLRTARWAHHLPGVRRLAEELDVSKDTVRAALRLLEQSGELKAAVAGRPRAVSQGKPRTTPTMNRHLRLGVLTSSLLQAETAYMLNLILTLARTLEQLGHEVILRSLASDRTAALAEMVRETNVDAWIVVTGSPARLKWFAAQKAPVFALGGRGDDAGLACSRTDLHEAMKQLVDTLAEAGHRRIVLIAPSYWHEPALSEPTEAFMQALTRHVRARQDYNLPQWEESVSGLESLLQALFATTPPTALIFVESSHAVAAIANLAKRRLSVPEDVSLVCLLHDPVFHLMPQTIAHFAWPTQPHIRRVTRWVADLQKGLANHTLKLVPTHLVTGGSIGRAKMTAQ